MEGKAKRQEKKVRKLRAQSGKDQEEAEEISFVPSAISIPQKPLFHCDNQCSEKTLSFWQSASVVIKEGEESYTTNLCQKMLQRVTEGKRRRTTNKVAVERVRGAKGARWKPLENDGKRTIRTRNVGIFLPRKSKSKEVAGGG